MKVYILLFLFGLAAADNWRRAVIDDAVDSFLESAGKTRSLRDTLGFYDAEELDEAEEDVKKEIVDMLKENLDKIANKLKDALDKGKEIKEKGLDKITEIVDKLKDLKENVGGKFKDLIERIKEKIKEKMQDKRALDEETGVSVQSKYHEFLERIKNKVLHNETLRKIREYIRNFVTTNPVIQKIKEFLLRLRDVDFRELLRGLFEGHNKVSRSLKETIKEWLEKLGITDPFQQLKDFLKEKLSIAKEKFDIAKEKLKGHVQIMKDLAKEVMSHAKDIHGEVAREAIEFFRLYKDDLGALWKQLYEVLKDKIKN